MKYRIVETDSRPDWLEIEVKIQYKFKQADLLKQALSHKSFANECRRRGIKGVEDNERLEFLGDAVLDLAISELLMEVEGAADEGHLSKRRASLVNEDSLNIIANKINLSSYLLLGKGEKASGGGEKPRLLACSLEALLGAIFKDSDYPTTKIIIGRLFEELIQKRADQTAFEKDYKTRFQEICQKQFFKLPEYEIVHEVGPSHAKVFTSEIVLDGKWLARGNGSSKKIAEQAAAKRAMELGI